MQLRCQKENTHKMIKIHSKGKQETPIEKK